MGTYNLSYIKYFNIFSNLDIAFIIFASFNANTSFTTSSNTTLTLNIKLSFPLRISAVNVTKSGVSYGFGHIY